VEVLLSLYLRLLARMVRIRDRLAIRFEVASLLLRAFDLIIA